MIEGRNCSKCKIYKLVENFNKSKKEKSGIESRCKLCVKKYSQMRYLRDKERLNNQTKEYKEKNPEKLKEQRRLYRLKTKDMVKIYREKNRDRINEIQRKGNKRRRLQNPELYRAKVQNRRHKEKQRGEFKPKDIRKINELQDGKCFYCDIELNNKYHIDHFIPISKGGVNTPDNLRLACSDCNLRKHAKMPEDFLKEINKIELLEIQWEFFKAG